MNIEIRLYKRFDIDLVTMCVAGYPVMNMMAEAIKAYAHGDPVFFYLDEPVPFGTTIKDAIRSRIAISKDDYETIRMLRGVKNGYKNNFCKTLLRNALITQNVGMYFVDGSLYNLIGANNSFLPINKFPNVKLCSQLREEYAEEFQSRLSVTQNQLEKTRNGSQQPRRTQTKNQQSPQGIGLNGYPAGAYPPPYWFGMPPQQGAYPFYGQPGQIPYPQQMDNQQAVFPPAQQTVEDIQTVSKPPESPPQQTITEQPTLPESEKPLTTDNSATSSSTPPDEDKIMALFDKL